MFRKILPVIFLCTITTNASPTINLKQVETTIALLRVPAVIIKNNLNIEQKTKYQHIANLSVDIIRLANEVLSMINDKDGKFEFHKYDYAWAAYDAVSLIMHLADLFKKSENTIQKTEDIKKLEKILDVFHTKIFPVIEGLAAFASAIQEDNTIQAADTRLKFKALNSAIRLLDNIITSKYKSTEQVLYGAALAISIALSIKDIYEMNNIKNDKEARNLAEEEAALKKAKDEAARKQAEEEAALKKAKDEAARKQAEEEAALKKAKDEAARNLAEEEAALKKAKDEAARKQAEEEAALKKAKDEAARKQAEEEAALKKAKDEAARKQAEEEAALKKAKDALEREKEKEREEARKRKLGEKQARKLELEEKEAQLKKLRAEIEELSENENERKATLEREIKDTVNQIQALQESDTAEQIQALEEKEEADIQAEETTFHNEALRISDPKNTIRIEWKRVDHIQKKLAYLEKLLRETNLEIIRRSAAAPDDESIKELMEIAEAKNQEIENEKGKLALTREKALKLSRAAKAANKNS